MNKKVFFSASWAKLTFIRHLSDICIDFFFRSSTKLENIIIGLSRNCDCERFECSRCDTRWDRAEAGGAGLRRTQAYFCWRVWGGTAKSHFFCSAAWLHINACLFLSFWYHWMMIVWWFLFDIFPLLHFF